jgi:hypothetical protein
MPITQKHKTPSNASAEFIRGWKDGYCQNLLRPILQSAQGRLLTDVEVARATSKLQQLSLNEIAGRVLNAKSLPAGAVRMAALIGGVS